MGLMISGQIAGTGCAGVEYWSTGVLWDGRAVEGSTPQYCNHAEYLLSGTCVLYDEYRLWISLLSWAPSLLFVLSSTDRRSHLATIRRTGWYTQDDNLVLSKRERAEAVGFVWGRLQEYYIDGDKQEQGKSQGIRAFIFRALTDVLCCPS